MIKNYPPISLGTAFFKELDYPLFISHALEVGYPHLDLANKYQKDATQIILRFIYQLGVIPVVKSSSLKHLKSNNDIWNFNISEEDMLLIKKLRKKGLSSS